MIASSWMDPVLGIDMHWEMVPTPAPVPMPFPHPFIGIVIDVGGLVGSVVMSGVMSAVFGAPFQGPVLNWFLPATNTGTGTKHIPGHFIIPPGTIWAPVPRTPKPKIRPGEKAVPAPPIKPENDAVAITGSKTVLIGGSNAVRLGDLQLSCSEPVRLPSSVTLAIPKGPLILIGGPPSLDVMAAIQASLRTRFVSDSLHALVSRLKPGRFRNLLDRTVCFFTGHPVDVASGKVMTSSVDAELPGPLPLRIERVYSSAFGDRDGPLGHGWSLSLDQAIWTERGKVVLLAEDGREIEFDTFDLPEHRMRPGDEVWHPIERLTLGCLEGGRWRVTASDGVAREFGPVTGRTDGRAMILSTRSRCGQHDIAYEYDAQGRLEWVRDACGRLVWLAHDAAGRLAALKLPVPSGEGWYTHRKYAYDAQGDLVQVTDALGHAWRFEYATHLLVRETDRTGLSFYFEYDGLGQDAWCTRTWGDGGIYDHRIAYDKVKKATFVTNSLGHTTQYQMNLAGLVVKVVDPLGGETGYEYDPGTLQKTAAIDPLGNATHWEYDHRGNCTRTTGPDGATVVVEYEHGRVSRAVDAMGGEWRWEYLASSGEFARTRNPRGAVAEYRWQAGLVCSTIDARGARTELEYDRQKNPTLVRNADGAETRLWWDALGRVTRIRDGRGGERRLRYDAESRLVESREPDGNVRRRTFDAEGYLVGYRDLLREMACGYTGFHELAWQEEGGAAQRLEYDTEGRLLAVVNERGDQHRFSLNERGDVVEERGFDGGRTRYRRDKAGRVVARVKPSGLTVETDYDAGGRVTAVKYSDGTEERFGYRPDGELVWAENSWGRVELVRDEVGNVIEEVQGDHRVKSHLDGGGLRQALDSSLGAHVSAFRSGTGAVNRLVIGGGPWERLELGFSRDALGAELERRLPGGVIAQWERDSAGRPTAHRIAAPGQHAVGRAYAWQTDDRLLEIADLAAGATTFVHDPRGRLAEVRYPGGHRQVRTTDAAGNLFHTAGQRDRVYGAGGRLEQDGGTTYLHDADGNVVEKRCPDGSAWRYAWNAAGQLAKVVRPDGGCVEFAYDALGRRTRKRWPGGETRFVWDANVLLHESTGTDLATWYFEPGSYAPIAKEQAGKRYTVVSDHLGTPTEVYDELGRLAWRMQLDAFGVGRADVAVTDCPWRWPGQYEDAETGLYYNRFRYYDPEQGAYLSKDPIGLRGGLLPYAYPLDPTVRCDPLGLAWTKCGYAEQPSPGPIKDPGLPDFVSRLKAAGINVTGVNINIVDDGGRIVGEVDVVTDMALIQFKGGSSSAYEIIEQVTIRTEPFVNRPVIAFITDVGRAGNRTVNGAARHGILATNDFSTLIAVLR